MAFIDPGAIFGVFRDNTPPTKMMLFPDLTSKLVIGTGISAMVTPQVPALKSWREVTQALLDAAIDSELLSHVNHGHFHRCLREDENLVHVVQDLFQKLSACISTVETVRFKDCIYAEFHGFVSKIGLWKRATSVSSAPDGKWNPSID